MRSRGGPLAALLLLLLLLAVVLAAAGLAAAGLAAAGGPGARRGPPPFAVGGGGAAGPTRGARRGPAGRSAAPGLRAPAGVARFAEALLALGARGQGPWAAFKYDRASRPLLFDAEGARVSPSLEIVEQWMAHEFLRPGDRVLELGARYGSVSITAARRVGPRGRVVAVEPDARVLPALERNRAANGADFLIFRGTLSSRPMRVEAAHEAGHPRNYSTFTVPRDGEGHGEEGGAPPVLRLAELEAAAGGPFTALIADCEGCLCEVPALPLLLGRLRVVLLEADAPLRCDYGRVRRALLAAGLRQAFGGRGMYQAWVRGR